MFKRALTGFVEDLTELLGSARKLVFIVVAGAAIGFTAVGILKADDFMTLAGMVFTFFFSKGDDEDPVG